MQLKSANCLLMSRCCRNAW